MPAKKRVAALQSEHRALWGDWPVLKKIAVNQLTVGMFVHGFEENWLKHPFWRSNCLIDVSKGPDVPGQKPRDAAANDSAPAEPRPAPKRERVPLSQELQEAAR